jgi:hypothetical protein
MERRQYKRIIVGFEAEILYEGKNYSGVIENLSESGISILTAPMQTEVDFKPGTSIEIKFQPPTGESPVLHCKIKWSYKISPHNLRSKIGMEIIDPPWEKSSFFI